MRNDEKSRLAMQTLWYILLGLLSLLGYLDFFNKRPPDWLFEAIILITLWLGYLVSKYITRR